jgi:hypothetical protein
MLEYVTQTQECYTLQASKPNIFVKPSITARPTNRLAPTQGRPSLAMPYYGDPLAGITA